MIRNCELKLGSSLVDALQSFPNGAHCHEEQKEAKKKTVHLNVGEESSGFRACYFYAKSIESQRITRSDTSLNIRRTHPQKYGAVCSLICQNP